MQDSETFKMDVSLSSDARQNKSVSGVKNTYTKYGKDLFFFFYASVPVAIQ